MLKAILLESSSSPALIAEMENGQIKRSQYFSQERGLSNHFFAFLKKLEIEPSFVAVGVGPGAYTGVRVSLTIAKSYSYALGIPIVSFSSLNSFIPKTNGEFLSILDAKIGGFYVSSACRMQSEVHFSEPILCSLDEIKALISSTRKVISPHVEILKKRILTFSDVEWILGKPDANMLAKICFDKFLKKDFVKIEDLNPIYLRDA